MIQNIFGVASRHLYGIAAFLVLMVVVTYLTLKAIACQFGWADTGYKVKYSYASGCLVLQNTGKWLPEDKVRPE